MTHIPMADWDWASLFAFVSVIGAVFGALLGLFRMMMSRNFVSHSDHIETRKRIDALDKQVAATATREDLQRLETRMSPVETGVAVLKAEVQAVKETTQRTEHMVGLLLEHQLRNEGATQ